MLSKKCMCWCFIHYWIEKCTVKQWNMYCMFIFTLRFTQEQRTKLPNLENQSKFLHWVLCHMVIISCDQYRLSFPVTTPTGWFQLTAVKVLHTKYKTGAGNGLLWLADMCYFINKQAFRFTIKFCSWSWRHWTLDGSSSVPGLSLHILSFNTLYK